MWEMLPKSLVQWYVTGGWGTKSIRSVCVVSKGHHQRVNNC